MNVESGAIVVREVVAGDRDAWQRIYRGYRDFYEMPHDPAVYETVWGWLMDHTHEERGLVVEIEGRTAGLAHFRRFARPLMGAYGIYLDDLFTEPAARGSGVASAVLVRLAEIARDEGATLVRWITADGNAVARSLYDRLSKQTPWVTYDLAPAAGS
ncbi:MAG: GNAT family N-acetyltransferase [Candidatus Leucobacter sulfamidivorax]|nr:GNAT family N-acetyltransferase [Candidatus Leucobacter sulfamidivorax]